MELRMSFNTFIKLKDASKISDISGEILEYNVFDKELTGMFLITGSFYKNDLDDLVNFKEEVPFNIMFVEDNVEVGDIDCVDLDYGLIDGRGLDVSFELIIKYSESNLDEDERLLDNIELIPAEDDGILPLVNETTNNEEIKDEITKEIERKLFESLSYKEDNNPTESFVSRISDTKKNIKVVYYESDRDLEQICKKNKVSINEVLKNNIDNDIDKYQRVIIK